MAFDGGRTSFAALARRGQRRVAVFLYVFDVLWLDGHDVRALPLRSRKRLLRGGARLQGPACASRRTATATARRSYEEACRKGWEGLIAKRADSPYSTSRSRDWLKFKCDQAQELVIGGFTAPKGSREELGALLLGHFDGDRLVYAGKVGTGLRPGDARRPGRAAARRCAASRRRSPTPTPSRSAA